MRASGQGSVTCALSWKAFTTGAHPSAWTETSRGFLRVQPIDSISENAFHIPTRPVPPPVGYTIASGNSPSCSYSSYAIVFLPSIR